MPDDPLRDDALGLGPEDVLGGSAAPPPAEPAADDPAVRPVVRAPDLDGPTGAVPPDDRPTTNLPRIAGSAPEPVVQTGLRAILAPWAVFGAVGVVLIAATTAWASWLRGPTADEDVPFPKFAPMATATSPPPATADLVALPPEPTVEPAPEPEPDPEPTRRAAERPRATQERAPAARSQAPAPPSASSGDEEPAQESEQTVSGNAASAPADGGEVPEAALSGPAADGESDESEQTRDSEDRDSEDDSDSESDSE